MAATQYDIAREVGVSQTTVSDVLQGRPRGRVSSDTKHRILETAQRLGYHPNLSARTLRTGRSYRVQFLLNREENSRSQLEAGLGGLTDGLSAWGYKVLLNTIPSSAYLEAEIRKTLGTRETDACVLRIVEEDKWTLAAIQDLSSSILILGEVSNPWFATLSFDSPGSIRAAMAHLVTRGHHDIALIASGSGTPKAGYFAEQWRLAAAEFAIDSTIWMAFTDACDEAKAVVTRWLSLSKRPTAFVCVAQRAAVGVKAALNESGIVLGQTGDLFVYGDDTLGDSISPWLFDPGTWYFDKVQTHIGRMAAERVIHLINGDLEPGPHRVLPQISQVN